MFSPLQLHTIYLGSSRGLSGFSASISLTLLVLFANAISASRTWGLKIHPQQAQITIPSFRHWILLHQFIRAHLRRTNGQGIYVQFIWVAIRDYLRMPFEIVQWSSQCNQDNLSPALPLPLSSHFVPYCNHPPVYASGSKSYWVGSYDSRGRTELVTSKICHHPWIGLRADPRRPRLCPFASMEDMGHRDSGMLDVISGSPPDDDWLNKRTNEIYSFLSFFLDIDLGFVLYAMPYARLCFLFAMLSFLLSCFAISSNQKKSNIVHLYIESYRTEMILDSLSKS